ncbi:hypothetical protein AUP68_17355 [Ilyonectria robusta]
MGRQPRKRQISCHFCRARKLRCNREFPCSNCTSRGVPCPEPQHAASPAAQRPAAKKAAPKAGETDIQSRLERLEGLLHGLSKHLEALPEQPQPTAVASFEPLAPQLPLPLKVQSLTNDALRLEASCIVTKTSDSFFSDSIVFRACPIRSITQLSSYIFQDLSSEPTRCIWLPNRGEAEVLVDKYLNDLTAIHHIVHAPSLKKMVTLIYDSLQMGTQISLGLVVLLLSILAMATYSWTPLDDEKKVFQDFKEANSQTLCWVKAAFNLLEICQRNAHNSLECVQGLTILSIAIFNLEGLSPRGRTTLARAIFMCRELGLNRLDHAYRDTLFEHYPPLTVLTAEVGRRVWWYLIGIDWMLARFPGPQEGTYLINPEHMAVRKPLNISDEDMAEGQELVAKPIDQPTSMSFFLQRIRVTEIFRVFSDRVPLEKSNTSAIRYETVLQIDAAIDSFIQHEIPAFFTMDAKSLGELPPNHPKRSRTISIQRHVLKIFVNGQRCRLHLPYLARGTVDPTYAHSREICLKSARLVLQGQQDLEKVDASFACTRLRMGVVAHSIFLAVIALLFDLCLVTDADDKVARQQEAEYAWKILEESEVQSVPVAKGMGILREVMEKYRIPVPKVNGHGQQEIVINGAHAAIPLRPCTTDNMGPPPGVDFGKDHHTGEDLEGQISRMDLEGVDWDRLFWGLDAPFI